MQEINEQQALALMTFEHAGCAVFLYTPLCGTCMAARKMLDVLYAMDNQLPLYTCNMNLAPELAKAWMIESIPCIVVLKQGRMVEKIYAMGSVPALYERFVSHGLMKAGTQS